MMVEEYGICPNCGHEIEEGSKFCNECGTKLEWKDDEICFPPKPQGNVMRYGTIKCECGQSFYFETRRDKINCIDCNKEYDISDYPVKEAEDGADIPDEDFSEESLEQLSE